MAAQFLYSILLAAVALFSQINMKLIASSNLNLMHTLSTNTPQQNIGLGLRIILPAGLSLGLTVYGYTKFGFLQLMIMQAFFYPIAYLVDHFLFKESFSYRMLSASVLVTLGVLLAIKK